MADSEQQTLDDLRVSINEAANAVMTTWDTHVIIPAERAAAELVTRAIEIDCLLTREIYVMIETMQRRQMFTRLRAGHVPKRPAMWLSQHWPRVLLRPIVWK